MSCILKDGSDVIAVTQGFPKVIHANFMRIKYPKMTKMSTTKIIGNIFVTYCIYDLINRRLSRNSPNLITHYLLLSLQRSVLFMSSTLPWRRRHRARCNDTGIIIECNGKQPKMNIFYLKSKKSNEREFNCVLTYF